MRPFTYALARPGRGYHPAQNGLGPARLVTAGCRHRTMSVFETGLHDSLDGTRPHHRGRDGPSGQERDRFDDQRLAGAGLSRKSRHPRAEDQGHVADHPKLADPELCEHARPTGPRG